MLSSSTGNDCFVPVCCMCVCQSLTLISACHLPLALVSHHVVTPEKDREGKKSPQSVVCQSRSQRTELKTVFRRDLHNVESASVAQWCKRPFGARLVSHWVFTSLSLSLSLSFSLSLSLSLSGSRNSLQVTKTIILLYIVVK